MLVEKFNKRMEELSEETQQLSEIREQLINQIREIEVRLTQIVGAMAEIKMILDSAEEPKAE